LRKAIVSFVMSVCPPAWKNLAPTQRIFMKFEYFSKICPKIRVLLKSDKNNGYITWRSILHFLIITHSIFQNEKYFRKKGVETIKTHFVFNNYFSKLVPFMRKSGKISYSRRGHRWQYGACALHAGYLSCKHTLRICNTYCCFIAKIVTWTRLGVTLYVHCLSC